MEFVQGWEDGSEAAAILSKIIMVRFHERNTEDSALLFFPLAVCPALLTDCLFY